MAGKNQVIKRGKVKIDGQLYETAGNVTLTPGGVTRTPVKGDYTAGAYQESLDESKLEFAALTKAGFNAIAFGRITDATVSIEFDNGLSYVIRDGYAEGPPAISGNDGTATCVLYGQPAEQVR